MYDRMYLIVIAAVLPALASRFILEGAFQKLENETKLLLLDHFAKDRRRTLVVVGIGFCIYLAVLKLYDQYVLQIFGSVSSVLLLYLIYQSVKVHRTLKALNLPESYLKKRMISSIIRLVSICGTMVIVLWPYPQTRNENYSYEMQAYDKMSKKDYKGALELYNKAVVADSTNTGTIQNRGTCKYFLKDTAGACSDWHKAIALGDTFAKANVRNFCR
jgi:uncharacterized membrane protein